MASPDAALLPTAAAANADANDNGNDSGNANAGAVLRAGPARRLQLLALLALVGLLIALRPLLPDWMMRLPEALQLPLAAWLNALFAFLLDDLHISVVTRAIADGVRWLLDVVRNLLLGGRKGFGLPALPWLTVAVGAALLGYYLKGVRLALLAGGTFVFLAVFGQWKFAMQTLAMVLVAVPLSVLLGLALGVWAFKNPTVETLLKPLLNICQSLPHFSYLIPVVVLFGVGNHAGAIATIIFATPPMVRLTLLGLKRLPPETVEAGLMSGCTSWQLLRHAQLPTARQELLVGVNQVVMQCLAMVVIASFIGAPGLGYRLLQMLQSLKIGKALEIGVAIVLIAITLDRLSKAWVERRPEYRAGDAPRRTLLARYRTPLVIIALLVGSVLLARWVPYFYLVPRSLTISTAPFWDALVDWVTLHWFDAAQTLRAFLSIEVLIPLRDFYLSLPTLAVLLLVGGLGWLAGGARSALVLAGYFLFIAVSGWWDRAMITAYMVTCAVVVSIVVGLLTGVWAAAGERRARLTLALCDTLQTFPSFIYLIPVIMLLQVNDVAAIAAVLVYSVIPAVRYTVEGLRSVPPTLLEATAMSGAGRLQTLLQLKLPLALPHILLGINQTIMFALFMVIIAAFIGTQDLGQEMMRALSANDIGKGLVLGFCVAAMGLAADHLLSRWAEARRQALGLA